MRDTIRAAEDTPDVLGGGVRCAPTLLLFRDMRARGAGKFALFLAALDGDAKLLDALHRRQLRYADLDPGSTELAKHDIGDRLGEALEELVWMIRGKCLQALDDRRIIERIGEIAGAETFSDGRPSSTSTRTVCGSSRSQS